ncbi:SMP-30/gluconolactonase/LRE family protein [Hymenobacter wooponensis]|uniref:SMP-30/gluconolactonase/LRE family protein n=1 Tax=Hymenobacter wooponensis TaxID=1525360 RepID=A0A4Z0MFG5_9BACT|nr:SMP-30/gluconolactonase/LRE family protein [Hymenobacter wooponensis]TGD78483.1 SMP-30/gluconolactonase/LRE family protein [Hymenobacter wooponensis]
METSHTLYLGLLATALLASAFTAAAGNGPATPQPPRSVVAEGAQLKLVAKQFKFTEGPATDKAGNVFFTDQPNDKIWKYGTDGKLSVFLEKSGRANGLYFNKQGNLLACADEQNQLWSIDKQGRPTVLLTQVNGHQLNGPNDLWIHPKTEGIYFTDPYYQRDYWTRQAPDPGLGGQNLYYLAAGQQAAVVVDDKLQKPNGIIGTPDGHLLYVADIGANKTYKYQISPEGRLTNRQLFVEQGSDGMTLDQEGNVYLTGKGVTVYNAAGQQIEHIDVPAEWTGNVCFAGKDRKTLFITASEAVYVLPMRVKGAQ